MRASTGYSEEPLSANAGQQAAAEALDRLGGGPVDLVLAFATAEHNSAELEAGIRRVLGDGPAIIGGGAVGAFTNERMGYGGSNVGLALVRLDGVRLDHLCRGGLDRDEAATGVALGRDLAGLGLADPQLLLLYDSVKAFDNRPYLNMATPLLEGLRQGCEPLPKISGAGLIGSITGLPTGQFTGHGIERQVAQLLAFSGGGVRLDTMIMHGCSPVTGYRTITRTDGPVVLEIDGRPAVEVVAEVLGNTGLTVEDFPFYVTLGVNLGDQWGEFDEESYQNRLCLGIDPERGGLVMFEPDLQAGMQVQLMQRSLDMGYVGPRVDELMRRIEGRKPVLAFYINCAGRAAAYCGLDQEDAVEVQSALAGKVPLLGLFSGVEIAPVRDRVVPLDWTGVLCVLSEG